MAIKIVIDMTNATKEEINRFEEIAQDKDFFFSKLFNEENIEVNIYNTEHQKIATDNNVIISAGLEPKYLMGYFDRNTVEKINRD